LLDETDLGKPAPDAAAVAARAGLTHEVADELLEIVHSVRGHPALARFFDPAQFVRASNELEIISDGLVLRADRVVEFGDAVWVLDYKARVTAEELPEYRRQIGGYREALLAIHAGRAVRAALIDIASCTLIECG
jgi:ATP-dependent helicase/nuclease subunit A